MDQRMNTQDMEGTRLFLLVFFSFRGGDYTTRKDTAILPLFEKKKKKKNPPTGKGG
jgi:hypothetical protein